MLVDRTNNEVILKIPNNILDLEELQQLLDYLRFKIIAKHSKAKKSDLLKLICLIEEKRKI